MKRTGYYEHASACLERWGEWARRPQFWQNLRITGMYALLPLPRESVRRPDRSLDAQSARLHAAVMRLGDDRMQGVLYAYYVRQINFDQMPDLFRRYGIGRTRFYELLKEGTVRSFNASKLLDSGQIAVLQ